jgi:hypothetical protein
MDMIEARDYIVNNNDLVKAKECLERERKIDMQRRNEKVEKMK